MKLVRLLVGLALSVLLVVSCATGGSTPSTSEIGTDAKTISEQNLIRYANRVETGGISLSLPYGWSVSRPYPGTEPFDLLDSEAMTEGVPLLFHDRVSQVGGWFRSIVFEQEVRPRQFFLFYTSRFIDDGAEVSLDPPEEEKGRSWYLLRSVQAGVDTETAVWFEKKTAYILSLQFQNQRKPGGENQLIDLPEEVARVRDSIFAGVRSVNPALEGRYIPGEIRFLSSSGWRWLGDLQDGILLSGKVTGSGKELAFPAAAAIESVDEQMDPAEFLAERLGDNISKEDVRSTRGTFLISNRPRDLEGAWAELDGGSLAVCYLFSNSNAQNDGNWSVCLTISPGLQGNPSPESGGASPAGVFEPDDFDENEDIGLLFERQLFFGWWEETEGEE